MKSKKENPYKEVLTQLIVDVFEKSGNTALNYKQVAAKLNVKDTDAKVAIADILNDGTRSGQFEQPERG